MKDGRWDDTRISWTVFPSQLNELDAVACAHTPLAVNATSTNALVKRRTACRAKAEVIGLRLCKNQPDQLGAFSVACAVMTAPRYSLMLNYARDPLQCGNSWTEGKPIANEWTPNDNDWLGEVAERQ